MISVFLNRVVLFAFWRHKSLSFGAVLCIPSLYLPPSKCQDPFTTPGTPTHRQILPRTIKNPTGEGENLDSREELSKSYQETVMYRKSRDKEVPKEGQSLVSDVHRMIDE